MANPWLKKNPLMSMWLSTANRMTGTLRGLATAEAKRQAGKAMTKAANDNRKALLDAAAPAPPQAKPRRRR